MENSETDKKTHKAHYYTRMFCIVMLYPISLFAIGLIPDTGEKTEALTALLMAIFSSLIVIPLIPVIFRGSITEKTVAIIISLPALWFGYCGWHDAISHFVGYRTLGL